MIIVTGANGFIGSCLVAELEARGHKNIVATDTIPLSVRPELLKHHRIDQFLLADQFFDFLKTPAANNISGIFHMGACSSTTEKNEVYLRQNNTEYTAHLFNFCTERQIPFIYASSAATYGSGEQGFDDEKPSSIYKPLNLYGWSKLNFDLIAEKQKQTPPRWAGLRFFNVFGPNEYHKGEMSSVVFKAVQQIRDTGQLRLFRSHRPDFEDGKQMRDFVYVKDVTRWMVEIWQAKKFTNGIYNMGFGKARTWVDLATAVFKSLDKDIKIDWIDMPDHIRNQYQYFTEAKMNKLLGQGLSPSEFSLEAGIADYIQNYLLKPNPYL